MKYTFQKILLLSAIAITPITITHNYAQASLSVISVQELAQLQKVLSETKKLVNTATEIYEEAERTANSVTGNGGFGREVLSDIAKLRKNLENGSIVFSQFPVEGNVDLEDIDFTDPEEIIQVLTEQFNRGAGLKEKQILTNTQNQAREKSVQDAVVDAQRIIGGMGDRLNKLSSLASEGDNTKTQKEATDLTNRLLIEILSIQTQQLELLARVARAEQLLKYDGVRKKQNDNGSSSESGGVRTRKGMGKDFPCLAVKNGCSTQKSYEYGL